MVALQIRDVPDDIRDALSTVAKARGMSLQSLLLELVTLEAHRARNLEVLERAGNRSGRYRARPGEAAQELADIRAERSAALGGDEC